MLDLTLHLRVAGVSLMSLAALHLFLPRRFHWKEETARLSLFTRQVFWVHTFFICLMLVEMGLLCLLAPQALLERALLGKLVGAGLTLFWAVRLGFQWFVYDRTLWQGKRFEGWMHGLFTLLWVYYVAVFGAVLGRQIL